MEEKEKTREVSENTSATHPLSENTKAAKASAKKPGITKKSKPAHSLIFQIACVVALAALVFILVLLIGKRMASPVLLPSEPTVELPVATIVLPEPVETAIPEDNSPEGRFLKLIEGFVTDILSQKGLSVREASALYAEEHLARLQEFDLKEMEDSVLVAIGEYYAQALELELQSFEEHYQKADLLWLEGYLQQMQVLTRLFNSYDLCKGNVKFIGAFVSPLAETSEFYSVYKVISTDLQRQIDSTAYLDYVNDYRYSLTIHNGTNYTYDITFTFLNYNKEDEETRELLCTAEDSLTDVEPLKSYVVTNRSEVRVSRIKYWECCWHLDAVKGSGK